MLDCIPFLGSGLGLRPEIRSEMFAHPDQVDFVEILADRFASLPHLWPDLERTRETFRFVVPHGLGLSVGSAAPPERSYLRALKRVSDFVDAPYYSDHLAVTRVPGLHLHGLAPVWLSEGTLRRTAEHVRFVQDYLGRPLVLEYITVVVQLPGSSMSTPEFFGRLVEATGCGILLDLTNVHINASNHGFDAFRLIDSMPLEAVVQVHLAGGYEKDGVLVDGHCSAVEEASWTLLEYLVKRTRLRGAVLEHDAEFPPASELFAQVARARALMTA